MRNDLGNFRVNVPRMLKLRGNLSNLQTALVSRITSGFLNSLQASVEDDASLRDAVQQCLTENALAVHNSADSVGVTHFGNSLLFDNGSHFEDFMFQTYETRGYGPARNRIEGLANQILSADRLSAEVTALSTAMLSRMDRSALTIADRQQWLADAIRQLSQILSAIDAEIEMNSQSRVVLEQDLAANAQRTRNVQVPVDAPPRGFARITNRLGKVLKNSQKPQSTSENVTGGIRRGIEQELLRVTLRETLLHAEHSLLGSLVATLGDEENRNGRAANDLSNAAREQASRAQATEASRGWNIAAGELTLNDRALTEAVMDCIWENRAGLWKTIRSAYVVDKGQEIFVTTEGIFHDADFDDIERIIRNLVANTLQDWTLVDVIIAGCNTTADLKGALIEAFRQVASRDFLTVGYDQFLPHRTYAIVTYAQSKDPDVNGAMDHLIQDVTRVVDAEVEIEADYFDHETVTFYIEDESVPITAMELFASSTAEYESNGIKGNPLYTPHPDIYRIISEAPDLSARIPNHQSAEVGVEGARSENGGHSENVRSMHASSSIEDAQAAQ